MSDPPSFSSFSPFRSSGWAKFQWSLIGLLISWKAWTAEVKSSLLSFFLMAIYVMGLCTCFIKIDIVLDFDYGVMM